MSALATLVSAGRILEGVPLAPFTTYKFGGPARYFLDARGDADLVTVAAVLSGGVLPVLILGRGSNLVVSDEGFDGLVVHLADTYVYVAIHDDGTVRSGGATPLPVLARDTVKAGRGGLEFFVGIPGSVGGAVRMNAGGHGSDTASVLRSVRIVDLTLGEVRERGVDSLGLTYRSSRLDDAEVVVEAVFSTHPSTVEDGEHHLREVSRWRREHQPGGTLNAGSVFKNPPGDSAGRLIDAAGLKGFRVGGAAVSTKHANFFEAEPGASAQDVYDLVVEIRERIGSGTGVWLVPEIKFAGRFERPTSP